MSRYSPSVLPQRGLTFAEALVGGVDAFRASRDRTRRQGFEDAAERRAQNADTRAGNQDRRAESAEGRDATRFEWQGQDREYENTTMRPMREAATRVGLMNEGMMAPGQAGGVEVAPGLRFDPSRMRLSREMAAQQQAIEQAKREFDLRQREIAQRLTIAREGDATQVRVAEINANRPRSGGLQFMFGGAGGGTPAQRQALGEWEMNSTNLEGINRQQDDAQKAFSDGMRDGFTSPRDSAAIANNLSRYAAQRDSIMQRQGQLAGIIRGDPPPMPRRDPRIARQQAVDGDYAARVTQRREAAVTALNAKKAELQAAGQWNAQAALQWTAAMRRARSAPATEIVPRP